MIASPHDIWLTNIGFHPAWIIVLVLAAHYGSRGMFLALGLSVAALSGAAFLLGNSFAGLQTRTSNPSDLFALAASLLVAWLAMMSERRTARLSRHLADAERDQMAASEALAAFHEHVAPLRQRYERIDLSVAMWRDLASRLESGDPALAARAALDLSAIRSGAMGGVVYYWQGSTLGLLSRCGRESSQPGASDISFDRTARAAVHLRHAVLATEVEAASEADSDVAAPILDEVTGSVLGVIALRGVSPTRLRTADVRDLTIVAQWLAPALMRAISPPLLQAAAANGGRT